MVEQSDTREFSRVPIHIVAAATSDGCDPVAGRVRDLSVNGLFLCTKVPMKAGVMCAILIQLAGQADGPLVRCRGEVVRAEDEGMAIKFLEVVGEESFEHLRNLVLYNANEVEHVEQEFRKHTGLKRWE